MSYCNRSPCRICTSCNLPPPPSAYSISFMSCQVKRKQRRRLTQFQRHVTTFFSPLPYSHLTLSTFSLTLHKPWTLNYSSCYFNDPLGLAQRITEEWLPNLPSFHHHLLIVFLLSVCSWAKNNWPPAVIWAGYPSLVMQDVRWAEVVYWINVVAKGCVDPGSNRRIKEWCLLLK